MKGPPGPLCQFSAFPVPSFRHLDCECNCPVAFETEQFAQPQEKEGFEDCVEMSVRSIASSHRLNLLIILRQYLKPYEFPKGSIMLGPIVWKGLMDREGHAYLSLHMFCSFSLLAHELMSLFVDGQKYFAVIN